ncbi:MAG: PrgI family protein [Candidatus Sungbacteria bacterium]|nr:PrgI family protein [Candidatus Sungbacteria bacterium]
MRQYQVPQFITVEDRVIGPLTIAQSLYLGAGAMIIVFIRVFLAPFFFWPLAVLIAAFCGGLAFLKINERPFPIIMKNAIIYLIRPRLYLWKKEQAPPHAVSTENTNPKPETSVNFIPKITESKLSDLAWSLDIKREQHEQ